MSRKDKSLVSRSTTALGSVSVLTKSDVDRRVSDRVTGKVRAIESRFVVLYAISEAWTGDVVEE